MEDQLQELFSVPSGLKPAYKMDNLTFYSSDKLKKNFVIAFMKSSKGKHIAKQIDTLVDKGIVIPCYKSKNILSFIKHKLTSDNKYIMAFYAVEDKKVVVIIDNSSTIFGTSSNNELTSTTMHECMHLVAGRNLQKFFQVFHKNLMKYYSAYYSDYLKIENINQKKIHEVLKFLIPFEKRGPGYANSQLANYYKLIEQLFINDSKLDNNEFRERLTNMIVASKLFILSMNSLMRNAGKFSMVFTSLNKAYQDAFGEQNKYTTPIQELVSMSEVACVLSEMKPLDPSIKKLFQIIA